MSYNKRVWANGDLITKEKINHMENGIYDAHDEIERLKNNTSTGGGGSGEVDLSRYVTKETGNANQITFADGTNYIYTHEAINDATWNPVSRYIRVTNADGNTSTSSISITIN